MFAHHQFSRLLFSAVLALPLAAHAELRYTVTTVGSAGSVAADINNSGVVVGRFNVGDTAEHAFVNYGSGMVDLGTFGGASSGARGINDAGQIVGYANTSGGLNRAFLYSGGSMIDIGTLGGANTVANGINNAGAVVGGSGDTAFIYAGGVMHSVAALPAEGPMSYATAINSSGTIVGTSRVGEETHPEVAFHGFINANGVLTDLGTFGGPTSYASAINDHGQVVGSADTFEGLHESHAFLYSNGVMMDLGFLPGNSFPRSFAYDINNLSQVVGLSTNGTAYGAAFLYEGAGLVDLNLLIDPTSGWILTEASAINDMQQIAATACRNGECFAVRLDPVPEPEQYGMLAAGLGLLGWVARRKPGRAA
jgi:probable HAF family extracellular repeat protein